MNIDAAEATGTVTDPFGQPAVEWGKEAARELLRGDDTERTRAVRDRSSLPVE